MGCNVDTISIGELSMIEKVHTIVIILYAWHCVCHFLDFSGLQIAKYLSNEIATRVQTSTDTDTAETRKQEKIFWFNNKYVIRNIILKLQGSIWFITFIFSAISLLLVINMLSSILELLMDIGDIKFEGVTCRKCE